MTKQTHNYSLKLEVDHLLHATRRFQCCDTSGRQTGTSLEGRETVNAAKTVSGQYAPVPLSRMANWKQVGSVSSSWDQDWPSFQAVGIKAGIFPTSIIICKVLLAWVNLNTD